MRLLLLFFLVMPNILLAQNSSSFSLTGKTTGFEDGTYLYFRDLANGGDIDSAEVRNNRFKFETVLPEPALFVMLFTKDRANFTELWLEDRPMTFDATKGDFKKAKISGSRSQELAAVVEKEVYANAGEIPDHILNQREKEFISKYPDDLISAYVLTLAMRRMSQDEVAEFFSKLSPGVQVSAIGKKVSKFLEKDIAEVGEKYEDLEVLNSEEDTVRISDLVGKLTLLQFWTSTCGFSREMNRSTLIKIYPKYRSRGFEVVTVSDEKNKQAWLKAIEEDEMNWSRSNNLLSANEEVFRAYGVNSTPSNFLINSEGIIVARNLTEEDLETTIQEHLRQ